MTAAINTNATTALTNFPYGNSTAVLPWPTVKPLLLKSPPAPAASPTSGVTNAATKLVTTAPNAAPMTMPTARSTTLPRRRNFRKPLMPGPFAAQGVDVGASLSHRPRPINPGSPSSQHQRQPGRRRGAGELRSLRCRRGDHDQTRIVVGAAVAGRNREDGECAGDDPGGRHVGRRRPVVAAGAEDVDEVSRPGQRRRRRAIGEA